MDDFCSSSEDSVLSVEDEKFTLSSGSPNCDRLLAVSNTEIGNFVDMIHAALEKLKSK